MSDPVASTRPATRQDEPAVFVIDAIAAAGDSERQQHLRDAIEAGECIVCEREGRMLGFAVLKRGHFYGRDFIDLLLWHWTPVGKELDAR